MNHMMANLFIGEENVFTTFPIAFGETPGGQPALSKHFLST